MQIIPLTYDFMFKNVFTDDLDILKEFLILETGLRLNPNDTKISILNGELPKENYKEYKKTIDIYISLNDKICIDVELNNGPFNEITNFRNELYASKLFSLMVEKGVDVRDIKDRQFIQLNLNTKDLTVEHGNDVLVTYGLVSKKVYIKNKKTFLKYLAYYREKYYTLNEKLNNAELWLIVILSENLVELYDLLENLLTKEKRDKFIRKVIRMSKDKFILSLWEKEKMDALKELAIIEDAEKRGLTNGMAKGIEQGIEQSKKEIVLNMHNKNFQVEDISEITNLSISEVETIINEFSNNSK
ncbi:MAG: Rpn family recombination-promoting nuclease/putative transposase [Bacilli bacterium]|nr:Rpn family recombination-promoting nuclease/putative transposase [Bacilli bacterium]